MMLYPELFIRSCTWLSPKAQHTGIWYIARSFPRFSAPLKTPGNHNVDAKQCQKQLSPRASPISPATMHGQKNALKQIPTFSKQPQRPLDQSLILKFSDHCSKVSFSSPNVMVLCFEATSGYRLNIVYNLCCPATVQTIFSIDWPGSAVWFPLDHFDMPERDSHASNSRGKILQPGGSFYNIASKSRWVDMLVPLNTFVAQLKM